MNQASLSSAILDPVGVVPHKQATKAKLTSVKRIGGRFAQSQNALERLRRKIHTMRITVAGDYSKIATGSPQQNDLESIWRPALDNQSLYDVLITDYEEGTSNKMLNTIRTLVLQVAFRFPMIEFEDLAAEEAAINSQYLKIRMGPKPRGCDAMHHMRLALLDYIISGVGWVWTGMQNGKPTVSAVDSLDVFWDTSARLITDIRWVSTAVTKPVSFWVDEMGYSLEKIMPDFQPDKDDDSYLDRAVTLLYYWDIDGPEGTHAVMRLSGTVVDTDTPVEHGSNPHFFEGDGYPQPFLPLEPVYLLSIPSCRSPIGLAEMMLPNQMALRSAERIQRAMVIRSVPFIDIEEGTYGPEEMEAIKSGEIGAIVTRKNGKPPANFISGEDYPAGLAQWIDRNDKEITAHGGADPYATGSKVEGVKYAAEVNAIQGASGLVAGALAKDHASHWERVVTKVLANAANFDDMPIGIRLDGTLMSFDVTDPIRFYLRPDADCVVTEDSMQFEAPDQRVAKAQRDLEVALEMAAAFPNAPRLEYEAYLRAAGKKNVAPYLEPPAPMPGMPPGAATPGQDPNQEAVDAASPGDAAASTQ